MTAFGSPLTIATMTASINKIQSPNRFLQKLLYPGSVSLRSEKIELSSTSKNRAMAPFTHKGAEGVMVPGWSEAWQSVEGPNIRIKRPVNPSEHAFVVPPGKHKYSADPRDNIRRAKSMNVQLLADYITNSIEWLVSQALVGVISYAVAGQDVFTISFPKPAGNNITLSTFWNDGTPANVKFYTGTIVPVKKVFAANDMPAPTDCILGSEAADALRVLLEGGHIPLFTQPNALIEAGTASFVENYDNDGVIYIGKLGGIRFWEYPRTVEMNGVSTSLIRAKYAEFISIGAGDRVLYYAAIPDMDAQDGVYVGERFAKEWKVPDPSAMMQLAHSRPLPVPRRPEATVSVKVVSG